MPETSPKQPSIPLSRLRIIWRDWRGFVLFIAVMLVFRSAIADWNQVPSGSMWPSIYVGDRIIVDKLAYDLRLPFTLYRLLSWQDPQRGDVVTFPSPEDERLLVKRVVGIPGDVISLTDNVLSINGEVAAYTPLEAQAIARIPVADSDHYQFFKEFILGDERSIMLHKATYSRRNSGFKALQVPPDHYLMMGDNRDNSRDSRDIGFISRDRILGRVETVAFSLDYDNYYSPRLDRFFADLP